jgi:hypothetical protein
MRFPWLNVVPATMGGIVVWVLHGCARTAEVASRAIQHSQKGLNGLAKPQSYQNVSRETFLSDWGPKPYKRAYIVPVCDGWDCTENWYFGREAGAAGRAAGIGMAAIAHHCTDVREQ